MFPWMTFHSSKVGHRDATRKDLTKWPEKRWYLLLNMQKTSRKECSCSLPSVLPMQKRFSSCVKSSAALSTALTSPQFCNPLSYCSTVSPWPKGHSMLLEEFSSCIWIHVVELLRSFSPNIWQVIPEAGLTGESPPSRTLQLTPKGYQGLWLGRAGCKMNRQSSAPSSLQHLERQIVKTNWLDQGNKCFWRI